MKKYDTTKSKQLHEETKKYLVKGVGSSFHITSYRPYPIAITHAKGSKLYDVDGNEYIDYVLGFGPIILGHAHPAVIEAVKAQLEEGSHFSAPTGKLLELSKKLTEIIPSAETVMYQNSGTEVVMNAFRIARAYTGKYHIIKFEGQYHGWSDEEKVSIDANSVDQLGNREHPNKILHTMGQKPNSADELIVLPWNDLNVIEETLKENDDVAAIIMEPVMYDSGPIMPKPGFLQGVRELATKYGVVLIFDEVITGFRLSLGGAQGYFGVTPDMSTFAKAITNGFPFGAIVGKREIMECGVPASGTFNGNPIGTAAALATIGVLSDKKVYEKMEELGHMLADGYHKLADEYGLKISTHVNGAVVDMYFGFENDPADLREWLSVADVPFYEEFIKRSEEYGIRYTDKRGRIYLSTQHTKEDIERTLEVAKQVFEDMKADGVIS